MVRARRGFAVTLEQTPDERDARFRACYEADYRALRRYAARLLGATADADDRLTKIGETTVEVAADPEERRSADFYESLHAFHLRVSQLRTSFRTTIAEAERVRKLVDALPEVSDSPAQKAGTTDVLRKELEEAISVIRPGGGDGDTQGARLSIALVMSFIGYSPFELPTKDWYDKLTEIESQIDRVSKRVQAVAARAARLRGPKLGVLNELTVCFGHTQLFGAAAHCRPRSS